MAICTKCPGPDAHVARFAGTGILPAKVSPWTRGPNFQKASTYHPGTPTFSSSAGTSSLWHISSAGIAQLRFNLEIGSSPGSCPGMSSQGIAA